jgi:alpha-ribazole phosphatase
MKLWLCRHAPVLLDAGICYGSTDLKADSAGTSLAAAQLAQVLPQGCPVWASPLTRTRQLANALRGLRPDLGAVVWDARLQEMDFGHWEMQTWDSIGQPAIDDWVSHFAHHAVGGAESTQDVVNRVALMVVKTQTLNVPDVVWVTHAGVIRAVQYLLQVPHTQGLSCDTWPIHAPKPGAYSCFDLAGFDGFKMSPTSPFC